MASSINASTSGAGGLITTADNSGILNLQTAGTTAVTIDTSQNATFAGSIIGKQSGIALPYQYYGLNTGYTGTTVTTAQSLFGVGVTLASSTIYEFESLLALGKTAGTTSHSVSILFGGTCTINNLNAYLYWTTTGTYSTYASSLGILTALNSGYAVFTSITSASAYGSVVLKGLISVNSGGTLIPQYQISANPGGAYTTQIGSYFKIAPLAASGANVNIGTWA